MSKFRFKKHVANQYNKPTNPPALKCLSTVFSVP